MVEERGNQTLIATSSNNNSNSLSGSDSPFPFHSQPSDNIYNNSGSANIDDYELVDTFTGVHDATKSEFIVLECLFAEPLFSEIEFGLPSSEDYTMIEPLFSKHGSFTPSKANHTNSCIGRNIENDHVAINKNVTVIVDDDEIRNYSVSNSMIGHNVNTNDSGDVTILPEALKSFPHCLHLVAARSERLKILRNTAIWRSIKLSAAWICVILFVFWLSSIFFSSTLPNNPFKFFFIFYLFFLGKF